VYQIPELLKYPKLIHCFSTKEDGNMANDILGNILNTSEVISNRERFLSKNKIDMEDVVCLWVQHGHDVVVADDRTAGDSMRDYNHAVKADGIITNEEGLSLFLLVADCLPVIIFDPLKEVVGLVHVGWKGADINIAGKAVEKMISEYRIDPKDMIVGFGPAAREDSFIKEKPSQDTDPKWKPFLEKIDGGKYKVDFVGLCKRQLQDVGILESNIFDCGIDTVKDKRFFSHVREGKLPVDKQGRFACIVGLKK